MGRWLLICLFVAQAQASAPDTIWTKKFGGMAADFAQGGIADMSGGYVLTGTYSHPAPSPRGADLYAIRVDGLTGDTVYARAVGGNSSDQGAGVHYGLFRTLFIGTTSSYGSNTPNVYAVALNAIGDTIWTRAFDEGFAEQGLAVDRVPDGDYYIAGWENSSGQPDLMLMKMDSTGTLLWTRTLGGSAIDWAFDVLALADGSCLVAGETTNFGVNAPPRSNAWLVKYDAAGDTVWSKTYGDSAHDERANEVILASDGGFLLAGYQSHPVGDEDIFVVKTDANGVEEWSRTYGGTGEDIALDIVASCDNYTIAGFTDSYGAGDRDAYLIEVDANGDTLWTKTIGGSLDDQLYALHSVCGPFYHAGYFATGLTKNNSSGTQDAWLVKLAAEPFIDITSPAPCDEYVVGSTISVYWDYQGFESFPYVSLELNRNYPGGTWEMITPSLYNFGFAQFTATAPAAANCRVRITKLDGASAVGISDPFSIIPQGNFSYPSADWDSSYNGSGGINDLIYLQDGGFVYPYGRSIEKRDSIGGLVWSTFFDYNTSYLELFTGRICQLTNGDFVAMGLVDSAVSGSPEYLTFMVSSDSGTVVSYGSLLRPLGRTVGSGDIVATDSGSYWVAAGTNLDNGSYLPLIAVMHSVNGAGLGVLFTDTCSMGCCALTDGGLLIAGQTGDIFVDEQDLYLISIDNDYDTLWTRTYDFGANEYAIRLERLSNSNYILLGQKLSTLGGTYSSFYAEFDALGNLIQQWDYVDRDNTIMVGLAVDSDGQIISSGSTSYINTQSEFLLTKFTCDGQIDWEIQYGGPNSEHFSALSPTMDGGYLATGSRFFPSGPGLGNNRPTAVKFGPETWVVPPTCPPADSLVILYNPGMNANLLTWKGSDQGAYFIYAATVYDSLFPSGNWSQVGCVEAGPPPAASVISWSDFNLTPETKFYRVVHRCNQVCGGGED